MSHPHFERKSQPELAYPIPRTRRRQLVVAMETGAVCAVLASSLIKRGPDALVVSLFLGGLLISAACYFRLYLTMKAIHLNPPRTLDERQNMITGQAYRKAFHILVIFVNLAFLLNLVGWLNWLNFKLIGIWIVTMAHALPMAVMAWTEPD